MVRAQLVQLNGLERLNLGQSSHRCDLGISKCLLDNAELAKPANRWRQKALDLLLKPGGHTSQRFRRLTG